MSFANVGSSAPQRYKCIICTDNELANPANGRQPDLDAIPDAVVRAPVLQAFNQGGQQVVAPVMLDVCLTCRKNQLKPLSKSGLIT